MANARTSEEVSRSEEALLAAVAAAAEALLQAEVVSESDGLTGRWRFSGRWWRVPVGTWSQASGWGNAS